MQAWLAFSAGVAFMALCVVPTVFVQRRRLRRYETALGDALIVRAPVVDDPCPDCGRELLYASMEDDYGPDLYVAEARAVYADGRPVFRSQDLSPKGRSTNEQWRGILAGAWCASCELFFPLARN